MEQITTTTNTSSVTNQVQRLKCGVLNYDWGLPAFVSRVASLYALNSSFSLDDLNKPFAEFWMGTHHSVPSYLSDSDCHVTLKSWLSSHPYTLGNKVLATWGPDLPFLFKVLSVGKALSIQAHPDKDLAALLHEKLPNIYKDANHKPEMALAISQFEALCGFVTIEELQDVIENVPEVGELIGKENKDRVLQFNVKNGHEKFKPLLKHVFTQLMSADKNVVAHVVSGVKPRLESESQRRSLTEKELLMLRLEQQYPEDVGVVAALFLNYMKLKPGEALYLGANEPHAYLNGDCIECMATSDNVVRAGLTPKLRDVQTLCSMLTYKQGRSEILQGIPINSYTRRYLPPFDEFEVDYCDIPQEATTKFSSVQGPSIYLVMAGQGTMATDILKEEITEGDVLFVGAECEILLTAKTELQIYRACVNSKFLSSS